MRPESLPKFDSIEEQFKYGSVGIESEEGFPYWIWQVLPRVFADKLPRPGGYAAFGFHVGARQGAAGRVFQSRISTVVRASRSTARSATRRLSARASSSRRRSSPPAPGTRSTRRPMCKFLQAVADDPRFDAGELLNAIGGLTTLSWTAAHAVSLPADSRGEARRLQATAPATTTGCTGTRSGDRGVSIPSTRSSSAS